MLPDEISILLGEEGRPLMVYKVGHISTSPNRVVNMKTPEFINYRLIEELTNSPDCNELTWFITLGLLRKEATSVRLYADWNKQTFDLTRFYEPSKRS
jgi:hypothetical protein